MAKKSVAVTLRKPPSADADAFVARGANDGRNVVVPAPSGPADEIVTRPDGRVLRELTVYLPSELARKLSLACMEKDRDVSNVLAEILADHLGGSPREPMPADVLGETLIVARRMVESLWSRLPRFARAVS